MNVQRIRNGNALHFEKVANITVNSDSINPQKKQNGRE